MVRLKLLKTSLLLNKFFANIFLIFLKNFQLTNLLLTSRPLIDALLVRKAKETVMKQTHGNYPAPLKILDVVRNGLIDGPQVGYEQETQVIYRRLRHVFHRKF